MFVTRLSRFAFLFDDLGDPSGGGPLPGAPAPAATPPATAGAPAAGVPGTGAVPGAPAPVETRPAYQYAEDRSRWIPPHRMEEMSQRQRQTEERLRNYEQRVRVLMGVAEPPDPRQAELASAMKQMFPGLAPLIDDPQLAQRVMQNLQQGGETAQFQASHWNRHAREMVTDATEQYAKAAGVNVDKLPPTIQAHMARQLQSYIAADQSGERRAAYEHRDPKFLSEFIADLTGVFVAPLRAAATTTSAQNVERARGLPSQRGPSGLPAASAGADTRPKGKAVHEAARQALVAAMGT